MNKNIVKYSVLGLLIICIGFCTYYFLIKSKDKKDNNTDNSNSNITSNSNINSNSNSNNNSNNNSNSNNNEVKVTGIKISTSKLSLEEGGSFKLKTIVLPNEATNRKVKWVSSNDKIAAVNSEGLVSAKTPGNAIIKAITVDGSKSVSCNVTVTKKKVSTIIKLDDISSIAKKYRSIDEEESRLLNELEKKYLDSNGNYINGMDNERYVALEKEILGQREQRNNEKIKLLNKLYDEKKTFIMLLKSDFCGEDDYPLADKTAILLDKRNIFYIKTYKHTEIEKSKFKKYESKMFGKQILIFSNGKIYADSYDYPAAFNSDSDVINWLSKYINIK